MTTTKREKRMNNVLHDDKGSHGLNNRSRTGDYTRVMTSPRGQHSLHTSIASRLLLLRDRRRGLEPNAKVDVLSVRDSALDTA